MPQAKLPKIDSFVDIGSGQSLLFSCIELETLVPGTSTVFEYLYSNTWYELYVNSGGPSTEYQFGTVPILSETITCPTEKNDSIDDSPSLVPVSILEFFTQ